jgi:glycosyltransferase involved in cell wall biosynthesis
MRFHLVSLPHTETIPGYEWCAFTNKVIKFADMMTGRGHEVFLYAGFRNSAKCTEHVNCAMHKPSTRMNVPEFDAASPLFATFNSRAITEIDKRIQPRDFVCLIGGRAQEPIAQAFPAHQVVEFGIGYAGVIPGVHHVWESYAWMHTVYGAMAGSGERADGLFYDEVIPGYFDPDEFHTDTPDGGYLLFVGRLIGRKGVQIALDTATACGMPLKVAGVGDFELPDWVDYRGLVEPGERATLMSGARAVLMPTTYIEPFGNVAIEAQMCGTPVITTDWGAFVETIEDGVTGFRCRTLREFVRAVNAAPSLNPERIRQRAVEKYSTDAIGPRYERYFKRLSTLWGDGWYELD